MPPPKPAGHIPAAAFDLPGLYLAAASALAGSLARGNREAIVYHLTALENVRRLAIREQRDAELAYMWIEPPSTLSAEAIERYCAAVDHAMNSPATST